MLQPVDVQRDAQGYWLHPQLADLPEDAAIADHPAAEGMEFVGVPLEECDGEVAVGYFERGETDISGWHPPVPVGPGWFVVAISDTDDGPWCIYARPAGTDVSTCIGCGCTDVRACQAETGPCHWLRVDRRVGRGVCSECPDHLARWDTGDRTSSGGFVGQKAS